MSKTVRQNHHIIYKSEKNKEVTRKIRKGCHQIITLIKRYNYLTDEELNAILIEMELKREFLEHSHSIEDVVWESDKERVENEKA